MKQLEKVSQPCDTRTTGGTRKLFKWYRYAKCFHRCKKIFVFKEFSHKFFYFSTV